MFKGPGIAFHLLVVLYCSTIEYCEHVLVLLCPFSYIKTSAEECR